MSLLKQDTIRKKQVDKILLKLEKELEFEIRGNKKYELKVIINSAIYGQQANSHQISGFYYLVFWKGYLEEKNTWKPSSIVKHFQKLISIFYKEYLKKPTATSQLLDSAPLMAKLMISIQEPK